MAFVLFCLAVELILGEMPLSNPHVFDRFGLRRPGLFNGFGGELKQDLRRKRVIREMELTKPVRDRIVIFTGSEAEQDETSGRSRIGVSWSGASSHGTQC